MSFREREAASGDVAVFDDVENRACRLLLQPLARVALVDTCVLGQLV